MLIAPPHTIDYGFYNGYITHAIGTDLITALENSWADVNTVIGNLSEEQLLFRYDAGKWSIKELMAHLVDAERNFCYRSMRFSRQNDMPLPPLDVYQFVMNSHATERDIKDILSELEFLRKATILMFKGMQPSMLELTGPARTPAGDIQVSVRALGFALAGHSMHHMAVIKERYLK